MTSNVSRVAPDKGQKLGAHVPRRRFRLVEKESKPLALYQPFDEELIALIPKLLIIRTKMIAVNQPS
jgi:hypothetical protein